MVLVATFCLLIFFTIKANNVLADTTYNYSYLNPSTQAFTDRLNQLPINFTFIKNLKRGQVVAPDVVYLKWILNSDSRTALTDNPNMTLTELNPSFGPLTENAVKRFQTVYRSEILDPQGIQSATGIVGVATKQKLNWLLSESRKVVKYPNNTYNNTASNNYNTNYNYNNSGYPVNYNYVDFSYSNNSASTSTDTISILNSTSSTYNSTTSEVVTSSDLPATTTVEVTDGTSTYLVTTNQDGTTVVTAGTTTVAGSSNGSSISNDSTGGNGFALIGILAGAALLNKALGGGAASAVGAAAGSTAASVAKQVVLSQFGGRVTLITPCTCGGNFMITLFDLSLKIPLSIIFQPGVSTLKMDYNPTIGQNVLGGYVRTPSACMVYVGSHCNPFGLPVGIIDTIRGIGTTLSPGPITP